MGTVDLIFGMFESLINLCQSIKNFLFTTVTIPFIGSFSVWQIIGGAGITIILTVIIIKAFV